jgi:hypothetical protein
MLCCRVLFWMIVFTIFWNRISIKSNFDKKFYILDEKSPFLCSYVLIPLFWVFLSLCIWITVADGTHLLLDLLGLVSSTDCIEQAIKCSESKASVESIREIGIPLAGSMLVLWLTLVINPLSSSGHGTFSGAKYLLRYLPAFQFPQFFFAAILLGYLPFVSEGIILMYFKIFTCSAEPELFEYTFYGTGIALLAWGIIHSHFQFTNFTASESPDWHICAYFEKIYEDNPKKLYLSVFRPLAIGNIEQVKRGDFNLAYWSAQKIGLLAVNKFNGIEYRSSVRDILKLIRNNYENELGKESLNFSECTGYEYIEKALENFNRG